MDDERKRTAETPDVDAPAVPGEGEDDVEGHSMLQMELHRQIATSRSKEAGDWARSEAARRAANTDKKRR